MHRTTAFVSVLPFTFPVLLIVAAIAAAIGSCAG